MIGATASEKLPMKNEYPGGTESPGVKPLRPDSTGPEGLSLGPAKMDPVVKDEILEGVWVIAEHKMDKLESSSLELITESRRLAGKLRRKLAVVLIGADLGNTVESAVKCGPDKIYLLDHEAFEEYDTRLHACAVAELIGREQPMVVLFGATPTGSDLAPRVAAKLKAGLVTNCIGLDLGKDGGLVFTKYIQDERLSASCVYTGQPPYMATVRCGMIDIEEPTAGILPQIVNVKPDIDPRVATITIAGRIEGDPATIDLGEADVIVAGGKGSKGMEGFGLLRELADLVRGSLGGSRPAVDKGWIDRERQIGQTGKRVSPDLFIACGISGATQFAMGMKDSRKLIAINTQRNAPIFKSADLKIVGDMHEVVAALIGLLKERIEKAGAGAKET